MKKFLCILFTAIAMCLLTSVVSAKTIYSTDDSTEFDFDDTLIVQGKAYMEYFYFSVPYSGTMEVTLQCSVPQKISRDSKYVFYIANDGSRYTAGLRNDVNFSTSSKIKETKSFIVTLSPGDYYILVGAFSLSASGYADESATLKITTNFTCLHNDTEENIIEKATCSETGLREVFCLDCEEVIELEELEKLDHVYGEWEVIKEPTVTSEGTERRKCKICKQSESRNFVPKHGEYGEWMVTEKSTCSKEGTESFICFCCNKATETRALEKTEHSYGKWLATSAASPEKDGVETAYCIVCQDAKTRSFAYDFASLKATAEKPAGFTDVSNTDWFSGVVGKCNHYGLMLGNSETTFNPGGNITIAEAITASVRVFCLYNPTLPKPVIGTDPWYNGYVNYAVANGIIKPGDFTDYTVPATREQMAYIFASAAGAENLTAINNYQWIPDVYADNPYRNEIFMLYNAGILTGSDDMGTFNPRSNITRAEAAAIIARITNISDRVKK